jgi:tetratricopeptide (TPR) repeat protein
LKEIEDKGGNIINIKIERSNIYLRTKSYAQAIEMCNFVLDDNLNTPTALFNRAIAYYNISEYELGDADLEYLIKISPDYKEAIKNEKIFKKKNEKIKKDSKNSEDKKEDKK